VKTQLIVGLLAGAVLVCCAGQSVAQAQEGTVVALAAWQGQGRAFDLGGGEALFLGAFGGTMFVENAQGDLHAAQLLCPGTLEARAGSDAYTSQGRCIITARNGDRVFAQWSCTGSIGAGCKGPFRLTGGTGRFQRIAGEGDIVLRIVLSEFVSLSKQESEHEMVGLAVWPALKYRIP
jgi:hypothetical protein